jgi:hypothetical protein
MEPTGLLSPEVSRAADFIVLKIPSLSAGFEPANLEPNGKHHNYPYITEP